MKAPRIYTKELQSLNSNPKSAPEDPWIKAPDPRPRITLDSSQLPEIANWKVGQSYTLEVKVEMLENRLDKSNRGDRFIGTFLMTHVGTEEKEPEKEMIDMNTYNK